VVYLEGLVHPDSATGAGIWLSGKRSDGAAGAGTRKSAGSRENEIAVALLLLWPQVEGSPLRHRETSRARVLRR